MNMNEKRIVALIPARAGSKRVPDKNIFFLGDHPLIAYTLTAAIQSEIFSSIIVSTDSQKYAEIAEYYGADVPFLRPRVLAGDTSPDIQWVDFTLKRLAERNQNFDCFSILRPTSPFRTGDTIKRAWRSFLADTNVDSLRAVELCSQHPGKMWVVRGGRMLPLLPFGPEEQPWHSSQYQSLPEIYVQNASLEIAWSRVVLEKKSISGDVIMPFFTRDKEGFDINHLYDIELAERYLARKNDILPIIDRPPFNTAD